MDKNLVDLILHILSLLTKHIENYSPSLNVSSLDGDPFVLSAFESAQLAATEEYGLTDVRNDRRQTEGLVRRCGLILVVTPTGVPHPHKEGD
jgi:hypothetical protein